MKSIYFWTGTLKVLEYLLSLLKLYNFIPSPSLSFVLFMIFVISSSFSMDISIIRIPDFIFSSVHLCETSIPQHYSLWGTFIYWSDIFGVYPLIWGFSGVLGSCIDMKSPTQTNGEYDNHKEILFIQGRLRSSMFYLYIGSERSAFQCAPILLARWQNVG